MDEFFIASANPIQNGGAIYGVGNSPASALADLETAIRRRIWSLAATALRLYPRSRTYKARTALEIASLNELLVGAGLAPETGTLSALAAKGQPK